MKRSALGLLVALLPSFAFAQGALLQAGPSAPGRVPQYVSQGNSQAIVQDSGPAAGGGPGLGLAELLLTMRGHGQPPYAGQGSGPLGTNFCNYDAPTTNPTGYHYLCLGPNAQGGGLLAYGAGGTASPLPFTLNINGTPIQFPGPGTGDVVGPLTSTPGNFALWADSEGRVLQNGGVPAPSAIIDATNASNITSGFLAGSRLANGASLENLNAAASNTLTGTLAGPLFSGAKVSANATPASPCDTSQYLSFFPDTASPQPSCFASVMAPTITVPFPAVVGIDSPSQNPNDQTHIQFGQHVIQAQTALDNTHQESGLVVNFISKTGGGGLPQTNWNEKVGIYAPCLAIPGAANTWCINDDLVILSGVGNYSMFRHEGDMTNFNCDYAPGGPCGNAFGDFLTFTGMPITAAMDFTGTANPGSANMHDGFLFQNPTTGAFTGSISGTTLTVTALTSGNVLPGQTLAGAGIAATTFITAQLPGGTPGGIGTYSVNHSQTVASEAIAGGWAVGNGLISDNTIFDSSSSTTSVTIAGAHTVGISTTLGNVAHAMLSAQGQDTCFNALDACWKYAGSNTLQYAQNGGIPLQISGTAGGLNGIVITSAPNGFGPQFKPAPGGGDTLVNLITGGIGGGAMIVQSDESVQGSLAATSFTVGSTAGVSCAAGSVSLTTLTITNGIVTHC